MADIQKDRVIAGNMSLLTSQLYSDITIRCSSDEYKLHRAIICPRSAFLTAACSGEFMEAKTATINMNDDDPQTVKRMLFYFYTQDYPDYDVPSMSAKHVVAGPYTPPHLRHKTPTTIQEVTDMSANLGLSDGATTTNDPRMMNNVLVYAVAEKYDIPDLKDLAKGKFQSLARSKWPHDDLYALAEEVFSTTPDTDMGLRQIVLDLCEQNFQDILKNEDSRAGLLVIPAIGAVVLGAAVRKIDQDRMLLDESLAKQIALKQELSKAEADFKEALDQKNKWTQRIDSLFGSANKIDECRHCHESFEWYLERLETFGSLGMQLRCANCRTRHTC